MTGQGAKARGKSIFEALFTPRMKRNQSVRRLQSKFHGGYNRPAEQNHGMPQTWERDCAQQFEGHVEQYQDGTWKETNVAKHVVLLVTKSSPFSCLRFRPMCWEGWKKEPVLTQRILTPTSKLKVFVSNTICQHHSFTSTKAVATAHPKSAHHPKSTVDPWGPTP